MVIGKKLRYSKVVIESLSLKVKPAQAEGVTDNELQVDPEAQVGLFDEKESI